MQSLVSDREKSARLGQNGLRPPLVSSREHEWKHILVEEFHQPPGEECHQNTTEHTLCLSLNSRPSRLYQRIGDRRHTGLAAKGDLSIAPADALFVSQWSHDDRYLRIQISREWVDQVAQFEFSKPSGSVNLLPEFRAKNPQIEQIGMMLLGELRNDGAAGQLYIESLTNILAVQLLRHFSATAPCDTAGERGLTSRQLLQVTDYMHNHLEMDIQLATLADLLGLSQFHFGRLFKQSMGISPYQYLLQQRVERAKQLLNTTDLSVMDIALQCGFSSHSHLGKWLRHYTGMTPKEFRS